MQWGADMVTPFVGVWIETSGMQCMRQFNSVTPFVGVWIETSFGVLSIFNLLSHPSWVCGLKQENYHSQATEEVVTPFVGVWIETRNGRIDVFDMQCHTLRGCVD